jgi:hypothetical protein
MNDFHLKPGREKGVTDKDDWPGFVGKLRFLRPFLLPHNHLGQADRLPNRAIALNFQ